MIEVLTDALSGDPAAIALVIVLGAAAVALAIVAYLIIRKN